MSELELEAEVSDETKIGLATMFMIICLMVAIVTGVYFSTEHEYCQKALAASTEIAKARLATEPLRAYNERLDAILSRLERIERIINVAEKP